MKTSGSPALNAYLQGIITAGGGNFCVADLFTITLVNGTVLRYTSWDQPLTVGGNTFIGSGPFLKRVAMSYKTGLEIDTFNLALSADATHQVDGIPILQSISQGNFDQAFVLVQRLFMPTPGDVSLGALTLNSYYVSDTEVNRTTATLTLKSLLELLDIQMPKNLYQPNCRHVLFDAGCTLNKAS